MTHRVRVYPHNDLFNLAHYQRELINQKVAEGIEDALSLDCMSCLISLAFTVEALINFIGYKRVQDWREWQPYINKMTQVCEAASLGFDKNTEPYKTIWELKELRDSIAHGQPIELNTTVRTREELRASMVCSWDQNLNPDYVNHAYDQVKQFERLLFDNCQISVGETLTSAVGIGV